MEPHAVRYSVLIIFRIERLIIIIITAFWRGLIGRVRTISLFILNNDVSPEKSHRSKTR